MIKETNSEFVIVEKKEKSKYKVNKKNIKIDVYDDELITNIFEKKFNKKYHELITLVNDESDTSDIMEIALLKLDELTSLLNNFYKHLSKEQIIKYKNFLNLGKEAIYKNLTRGKSR